MQLCLQSSKYFSSSVITASAAFLQSSLGSMHPASRQSFDMKRQHSLTSSGFSATRFVLTSKQSSRAKTQVLMYLNLLKTSSRSLFLVISNSTSPRILIIMRLLYFYEFQLLIQFTKISFAAPFFQPLLRVRKICL